MPTTVDNILAAVNSELGVTRAQIMAPTRSSARVARARQVAAYLYHYTHPSVSWSEIGRLFGRDRTTVRHAANKVLDLACSDIVFGEQLRRLERASTSPI